MWYALCQPRSERPSEVEGEREREREREREGGEREEREREEEEGETFTNQPYWNLLIMCLRGHPGIFSSAHDSSYTCGWV